MGLLGAIGRALMGKPAYTAADVAKPAGEQAVGQPGAKVVPVVRIGRVECHANGNRLDIYADIHNESIEPIFLDFVLLLGTRRELDSQLSPGQSHQFLVYSGPLLANQPSGYAEIHYRKQVDGDYFVDYHQLRSRQESAAGWVITEMLLQGPVKDI